MSELPIVPLLVSNAVGDLHNINYVREVDGTLSRVTYLQDGAKVELDPASLAVLNGLRDLIAAQSKGTADNPTVVNNPLDLRGLASARPDAGSVPAGTTYWSVDEDVREVSDGSVWSTYGQANRSPFVVRGRAPLPHEGVDGDVWLQLPGVLPTVPAGDMWEQGSLASNDGRETASPNRARTKEFLPCPEDSMQVVWNAAAGVDYVILFYGPEPRPDGSGFLATTGWLLESGKVVTPPPGTMFLRVVISNVRDPANGVSLPATVDAGSIQLKAVP